MLRRSFRIGLLVGLLGGALAAVAKAVQSRGSGSVSPATNAPAAWTPLPDAQPVVVPARPSGSTVRATAPIADLQESPITPPRGTPAATVSEPVVVPETPAPAKKAASKKVTAPKSVEPWVDPVDGDAPATHPIKAKMSSGIFHVPGGLNYDRTRPDRCYRDVAAAEADGLRQAKR